MIKNFGDHAANERTLLAWVRTAIAVMAFGFIVEKFDLFLQLAAPQLAGRTLSVPGQKFGNVVGLSLIIVGTAMVAVAAARFLSTAKHIDSAETHPAQDHGSIWRWRLSWSCLDALSFSISRTPLWLQSDSATRRRLLNRAYLSS
jgi:putative membrane protein